MKVKPIIRNDITVAYVIESPMTGDTYCFYTKESGEQVYWDFNGNMEKPTFWPSMLNKSTGEHFFVTEGEVHYMMSNGNNKIMKMVNIE